MRYIMNGAFKSGVVNLRFVCGVLVVFLTAIAVGIPYIEAILKSTYESDGQGWFSVYIYCITAADSLLFVPIAVTIAAGINTQLELKSRFSLFCCSRLGRKKYLCLKVSEIVVSGGLIVCFALWLLAILLYFMSKEFQVLSCIALEPMSLLKEISISSLRGFLYGALWAMVGSVSAVISHNLYMAYTVPFILYYVLTLFQERYYRSLHFLNPRYWMAPVYYGNVFCIMTLLMLCVLCGFLFIFILKRRLEHV